MSNGVIFCDDLIFTSKVSATARAHGFAVVSAKTVDQTLAHVTAIHATVVILDLHAPGLDVASMVEKLKLGNPVPRIIAFGPHVDAKALKGARASGCDVVMPRSQFVSELETRMPDWFAAAETPAE